MTRGGSLMTGVGAGIVLAYFLDPNSGNRRRARARDQMAHGVRLGRVAAGRTARDLRNRVSGSTAAVTRVFDRADADNDALVARVRAAMGRLVSHSHAIEVRAQNGTVTLRGPVLAAEVPTLLSRIARVRGVRHVVDELEPHKEAGSVPALQGGAGRPEPPRLDVFQRRWAPATRLLTGVSGAALAGYGASRRDFPGWLLAVGGATLMAQAGTNLEASRLLGLGGGRRAVDVQKTINIDAPVSEVFDFWQAYENFPRFLSGVLDVRRSRLEGRSHWTVAGPGGASVEFDAEIVQLEPDKLIAWRTAEGSMIGHAGLVRFDPTPDGGTRVTVRMAYNPPGGWIGHGLASVFGVDPKQALDADLVRMKTLLETGQPAHDAARPARPPFEAGS